jgi:glutathione S-transferase
VILYGHPFSSYYQKAVIAFYENRIPFELRLLEGSAAWRDFSGVWPLARMPVLVDGERTLMEATIIIEYLAVEHPGPVPLVPADPRAALEARLLDRIFDNYVATPMQKIVTDHLRDAKERDARGVADAHALLGRSYRWLDERLAGREWAAGGSFGLADCAAAPSLLYADWVQPIDPALAHLSAYRRRLLARPSFARAVDEARPYRASFPPGAPDRD